MKKQNLLVILGPTAAGKTALSIELARKLNGAIISADSMQIYKHMDIGTAKPSLEEMKDITHYLIDNVNPNTDYSVALYQKEAQKYINKINYDGKLPILVGGTGLYINSIIYDMDFTDTISNKNLRRKLQEEACKYGNEYIHNKLKQIDPEVAKRIHHNNVKRVIRAIEVYSESGKSIGDFRKSLTTNNLYNCILIGITRDRKELYDRINKRVDLMIENGLVEEVRGLLKLGYKEDLIAFKGLGYKEIIMYLSGNCTLEEAIKILKKDTRRYAKRQLTWFKRLDNVIWYNLSEHSSEENLINNIKEYVEGKFNIL